jgi:hypothetical protein
LLSKQIQKLNSIGAFFIKTGILLISGRAIKIYTLQKKILITATDIFAISSQKQFEKQPKSISISTRKQLCREFCDLMKVESQKIKHSNRFRFTHSVFQKPCCGF